MTQKAVEVDHLPTIVAEKNPFGVQLIDLRPITLQMIGSSKDPQASIHARSYGIEDGSSFSGNQPDNNRKIESTLSYKVADKLYPGSLFIPTQMEHKWAIFYDGAFIYMVRSWTREVVVRARVSQEGDTLHVKWIEGAFLDDASLETERYTEAIFHYLMRSHALNDITPVPLPKSLETTPNEAAVWAFVLFGHKAIVGVFDEAYRNETEAELRSTTALHISIANGEYEEVETQLEQGMDIELLAQDGFRPLHWSLYAKDQKMVELLLEKGADVEGLSLAGTTPLMDAVQLRELDLVKMLIEHDARVNATDHNGFTALHRAAEMGLTEIVEYLLSKQADPSIVAKGYTALDLAEYRKERDIVARLKAHIN